MRILAMICALVLTGCQTMAPTTHHIETTETSNDVTLVQLQQQIDRDYIAPFASGEIERWLEIFDDDIVGLHNRVPAMEGKEALRQFGAFVAQNLIVGEMSVRLSGLRQKNDLAYTWGTYHSRLLMRESGEPMPGHSENGKVLFVWNRQATGSWKIAVDMGNELPMIGAQP